MGFFDRVGRFLDDVLFLPDDVRVVLESAEAALQAGRFEEAEGLLLDVLAARPQLVRAVVGLAHARQGLGDGPGTLAALEEARQLVPEDGDLALWTAQLALEQGRVDLAATAAGDAARARADTGGAPLAEACALVAWAEWRRGRPDRAARELRKALSAEPGRRDLQVTLVEALAAGRDPGGARAAASQLRASELDAGDAVRVGQALAQVGAARDARTFLEVAAATGEPRAKVALARDALGRRSLTEAERLAREAVAGGGGAPALRVLAEVLEAAGAYADAAEAFAAAAGEDVELLRAAARVAPRDQALPYVGALERIAPGDPVAQAVRGWVEGRAVSGEEPRACLARARASLDAGDARAALVALDAFAAASPTLDRPEAEALRREALRALWSAGGELDLASAIDAVARFGEQHELDEVARRARALRDELDRPLLLGVLGEFNAGKSTLINAFIGAEVAPMGIVPTTATLNVLRGGAERLVRIVYRDGRTREGTYEALRQMLSEVEVLGSDAAGAEGVDRVEIVLPSETLERVWILDAPGTNALDAEHERLAKEAARRADAVLWVFDAAQAGKETETRMHAQLRAQGRLVVPVLNKTDRLKEGECRRVSEVIEAGFGVRPIAISAKAALKARVAGDEAAYEQSGFGALLANLEERVFSRARQLKHAACAGRLAEELDKALVKEAELHQQLTTRRGQIIRSRESLVAHGSDLLLAVDDALRAMEGDLEAAFDAAAEEVLAFARPRAHQFAVHGAHPEDRAFLARMLERRLHDAVGVCERRLVARAGGILAGDAPVAELDERVRAAIRPALAAFWGYQRGILAGALQHFFRAVLPRADLRKEVLGPALARARVDAREELRGPLQEALGELHRTFVQERDEALEALDVDAERSALTVFGPMRALRQVLAEVAGLETEGSLATSGSVD